MLPDETLIEYVNRRLQAEQAMTLNNLSDFDSKMRENVLEAIVSSINLMHKRYDFEDEEYLFLELKNYSADRNNSTSMKGREGEEVFFKTFLSFEGILNESGFEPNFSIVASALKARKSFRPHLSDDEYLANLGYLP